MRDKSSDLLFALINRIEVGLLNFSFLPIDVESLFSFTGHFLEFDDKYLTIGTETWIVYNCTKVKFQNVRNKQQPGCTTTRNFFYFGYRSCLATVEVT